MQGLKFEKLKLEIGSARLIILKSTRTSYFQPLTS